MITITLVLKVGRLVHGVFQESDEYDLESEESVGDILIGVDPINTRAHLLIHVTGWPDNGRTLCSYKRIKIKNKRGSSYRWIVLD